MGQALAHRPFADALQESSLMLGPMTREELRAAIERPAEKQGAALEAGLVERLLDDVGEEPGNLPLLEFALTLLWERLDYGWMTHRAYEEIGRVEGALARYADQVYGELVEDEREGARRIFTQLVQPGEGTEDTRRVAARAELGDDPVLGGQDKGNWTLVQHLADRRLVVTGQDTTTGGETVEVVHEALIQRWGQLRDWMAEDRAFRTWQERLRAALSQWQATGQDEGVLLRGAPLAEAEGWLGEREDELSTSERAFIQNSVALRERRQTERDRRRRRTILALAGGLVVALILVLLAGQQWQRAEGEVDARATAQAQEAAQRVRAETESQARATQQAIAEEQRHAALVQASIGLGSQALIELEGSYPERSVLLALEALENYPYTWHAERALGQAVLDSRLRLILQHEAGLLDARWSPDGTRIVTGSSDGTARVWDASASSPTYGKELLTVSGHQGVVMSAAWSPLGDRILTASEDRTAKVWDASASSPTYGEELLEITGHTAMVNSGRWSPDGTRILTASDDRTAKIWDASASSPTYGEELLTLRGHRLFVQSAVWSSSGMQILTTSGDDTARVWDASPSSPTYGDQLLELRGHTDDVWTGMWSPDGSRIVTVSRDDTAKVWDATTGEEVLTFSEHKENVTTGDWSPDGTRIATSDWYGTVRVWDAITGEEIIPPFGRTSEVSGVAWSPDGDRLLTAGWDGTAKVWDLDPSYLTIAGKPGRMMDLEVVAWSPQGDRLMRGYHDGTVEMWDVLPSSPTYGEKLFVLPFRHSPLFKIAWSPSGDRIVTADGTGGDDIKMWDAASGERLPFLSAAYADRVEWSPDGTRILASVAIYEYVWILDAGSGETLLTFLGDEYQVWDAAWSADGTEIVTVGQSGTARIWNADTGELIRDLYPETYEIPVSAVAWSPDGRFIVTCADDGSGSVWDASASSPTYGEDLVTFSGYTGWVGSVYWSHTGERLVTTSTDGTVRVWDVSTALKKGTNTGVEILRYPGVNAAWSPDGTRIAIASADGALRVFAAWQTTQELIDYAKECCVVRELTDEEREQFGLGPR